ncbi:antitoxin [Bacillus phage vB_BanS-Thrax3]|nr:antitoxin [Bacillus phage vB_BanS-Thrax3]
MEKDSKFEKKLIANVYTMVSSMVVLGLNGAVPELAYILDSVGIEEEQMEEIRDFINGVWDAKTLDEITVQQAKLNYLDAFREVVKLKEIADGYQAMGAINLQIAEEDKHLEDEGEKLVNEEMAKEKTEGTTEEE